MFIFPVRFHNNRLKVWAVRSHLSQREERKLSVLGCCDCDYLRNASRHNKSLDASSSESWLSSRLVLSWHVTDNARKETAALKLKKRYTFFIVDTNKRGFVNFFFFLNYILVVVAPYVGICAVLSSSRLSHGIKCCWRTFLLIVVLFVEIKLVWKDGIRAWLIYLYQRGNCRYALT